jgi:subtilisin family serine protease
MDNGTSFSCPITAGAFACLREAFPKVPNMVLIDAVQRSADHYAHPDSVYGYGIPDFGAAYNYLKTMYPNDTLLLNPNMVYPDPFTNVINIKAQSVGNGAIDIDLYNTIGQKVWMSSYPAVLFRQDDISLTIPDLEAGVYILHINSIYTVRMVKE